MTTERFEEIVSRYADDRATAGELSELEAAMNADPALRRAFVERMRLEVSLGTLFESAAGKSESQPVRRSVRWAPSPAARPLRLAIGLAAAALVAALLYVATRPGPAETQRPEPPAARNERGRAEEESVRAEADRKVVEETLASLRKREEEAARERERQQEQAQHRRAAEELKRIQADREAAEGKLREAEARERRAREEVTRLAEPPPPPPPPAPPPAPTEVAVARIDRLEGTVAVLSKGGRRLAVPGQSLLAGEGVECAGLRSFAVLSFADRSRLELAGDSVLRELADPAEKGKRVVIDRGVLKAEVAKQPKEQPLLFVTPHGEAKVLGTTLRLSVDPDPKKGTALEVEEGKVELRNAAGRMTEVSAGHTAVAAAGAPLAVRALPKEEVVLAFDFEDGRTPPLVAMGAVERGPDRRLCLAGVPEPSGVCRLFVSHDVLGLFTIQGDEVLSFDYWADPQAAQVNFNFYSRSRGQSFEGMVPKVVLGRWAHATFRLADLGTPGARLREEDWVVMLYMQAAGATAKRLYIDNLLITRPRSLKPRPSEARK